MAPKKDLCPPIFFLENQRKFAFAIAQCKLAPSLPGTECGYASRAGNDVMLDLPCLAQIFLQKSFFYCVERSLRLLS